MIYVLEFLCFGLMNLPELLMPAGDLEKAYTAFAYGADAIYCGVPMFSLRTRENVFTNENLEEIVEYAHKNNKKVYVTTNAFPHQNLIKLYEKHFKFLEKIKPDGIIFADLGVLSLANEFAPSIPKHLSVQTSTVNAPAIKLWKSLGVERIILAREMAISEVAQIKKLIPDMELEYFVHGAVCMAYSGRCLLSNFTGGRDANRGACNHTCRWNYRVYDEEGRNVDVGDHYGDNIKPVLFFDFDGVLWDSEDRCFALLQALAKEKGKKFSKQDFESLYMGNFWENIFALGYDENDKKRFYELKSVLKNSSKFYNGAVEFVKEISKFFNCKIISSNSEVYIKQYLKKNNLDLCFTEIIGTGTKGNKEEKFKKFLKNNSAPKVLFITDTIGDVKEASMIDEISTIAVSWGIHKKKDFKDNKVLAIANSFDELKNILIKDKSIRDFEEFNLIEEEERQGQMMPVEEDFHGTHIMSSKDMCMIENLEEIMKAGVCSLKVEGRNKTAYYCATIARAYRKALDDLAEGKEFDKNLWEEIHATANRGFFPGFLHGKPASGSMQYEANRSTSDKEFCGVVLGWEDERAIIQVKNRIEEGSKLEFVMPKMADDFVIKAEEMKFGENRVDTLHGGNDNKPSSIKCEKEVLKGIFVRQKTRNPAQVK